MKNRFGLPISKDELMRWHLALMLVSMDAVTPFWREMGLKLEKSDTLQSLAKGFVRAYRQINSDTSLESHQMFVGQQKLWFETFEKIESALGNKVAQTLYDWGDKTFQYESDIDAKAFIWRRLLRRLGGITNLSYPYADPLLPEAKLQIVRRVVKAHLDNPGELEKRINMIEKGIRSSWDEQVFKSYTSDSSPMDWVLNSIEFVNTRAGWREIEAALNPDELLLLLDWGKKQAAIMGMSSESIELPQFNYDEGNL